MNTSASQPASASAQPAHEPLKEKNAVEEQNVVTSPTTEQTPIHVMHIIDKLSVSGSGVHGVAKALEWWIPAFDPNKFRFSLCSLRSPEPAGDVFRQQGTPVHFIDKSKFDPTTIPALISLIKREKPDIIHLHGYGATNFGRIASLFTGVPNIVHEHTVIDDQPLYQTIADTVLAPLTTTAIAISKPVYDFMVERRKLTPAHTFFYGLPLDKFQAPAPEQVEQTRQALAIPSEESVVCNVGRLDTQKGQLYLLQAAVSVLKARPNTRFLIVGEGPDRAMLETFAKEQGIDQQVTFTGLRKDVPALLALSDIVAIPSLWEGGPITLFEAMNISKPVIGTPVGLMGNVIQEGKTGFVVPKETAAPLAEKLIYLLQNPDQAQAMGKKGGEICQQYDIAHSAGQLSRIYTELATA
ncbi:MAG: glycosyltransferase [Phormidesmis sp.]